MYLIRYDISNDLYYQFDFIFNDEGIEKIPTQIIYQKFKIFETLRK